MPKGQRREVQEGGIPAGEELLTIREVAEILRVDGTTCRRWIKFGVLEAVILPHACSRVAYRIKRGTIDTLTAPRKVTVRHV